jgi:hypothetical protein
MSCLQEAGYCCRGSEGSAAVMRLPGQAQDELWAAVNKGDGAAARRITAPLRLNPTAVSQPAAAAALAVNPGDVANILAVGVGMRGLELCACSAWCFA